MLKDQHCGQAGLARANVHTAAPGSTLHLVWDEYVQHPGWFRISFQKNGDIFEIPPVSTGKTGNGNPSNYPTENLTGMTDPASGSLIISDRIVDGTTSADVVLPNVECNNCTLQLIQLMTDKPPYSSDVSSDDIYFACVDLVLTNAGAPDAGAGGGIDAGPTGVDAGPVVGSGPDAGVTGGDAGTTGGSSGGCSVGGKDATGASLLALAVGLVLSRRRKRR